MTAARRPAKEEIVIEKIAPWVEGKRVLLLGFGREGRSTWELLKELGVCREVHVADQKEPEQIPEGIGAWISGPEYQKCMDQYDVVFKSPGIVLERPQQEYRCRILSQTEVFFQCFRDQIIGITGTKGKSTTTTLVYHLLKEAGMDAMIAGNIGIPVFDRIREIHPDTKIVCELSCHQLEYMTVSPHIGVLVNIYEEHLDHYGTMEKYVEAKRRIYRNQKPGDILICNVQCLPEPGTCPSRLIRAELLEEGEQPERTEDRMEAAWVQGRSELFWENETYVIPREEIRLQGRHNDFDIGIAYVICRLLGVDGQTFTDGLKSYEPLPHRLQLVGVKDGVKYYDDSISTICETTIQALQTLTDTDTVLIGGMDRGIDYTELIRFLSECPVPHILLMEETGKRIRKEIWEDAGFKGKERLHLAEHLEDAVELARKLTRPGHSCLLSPAAASYGIFRNFEERGEVFTSLVMGRE